jgi:hypothetical protein
MLWSEVWKLNTKSRLLSEIRMRLDHGESLPTGAIGVTVADALGSSLKEMIPCLRSNGSTVKIGGETPEEEVPLELLPWEALLKEWMARGKSI